MLARRFNRAAGTILGLFLPLSLFASSGFAGTLSVTSPRHQVGLLELYTSEGCSSCPPADRWVSSLKEEPGLWRDFIPVAFHVDYWDYIGWPDRFASPEFTARQREHAAQQSMRTVYTPGFFLNGKEWRWRNRTLAQDTGTRTVGALSLDVTDQSARVRFDTDQQEQNLSATIALLGFDIETRVKAGENSGRTLSHDFVVLSVENASLRREDGDYVGTLSVPTSETDAARYALVAWVNPTGNPTPIQVVGGWLGGPE
jgi:hypothetical protein